jgi:hypothetical protein
VDGLLLGVKNGKEIGITLNIAVNAARETGALRKALNQLSLL